VLQKIICLIIFPGQGIVKNEKKRVSPVEILVVATPAIPGIPGNEDPESWRWRAPALGNRFFVAPWAREAMRCKGWTDDGRKGEVCSCPMACSLVEGHRIRSSTGHSMISHTGDPARKGLGDASCPHVLRLERLTSWLKNGSSVGAEKWVESSEWAFWAVPHRFAEREWPLCRG
jgi:hypothetical protein